jgi:flagellin
MSQVINTNVLSLTAQRNLQTSQSQLATSLQRLSSGLRINSAKDDAAGLAISERFTTQIRGLGQAIRNANDGISLSQTGEAALATVTDNLQRIRELAVQSVNATNSNADRATLDQEVQQRLEEIGRIANQTSFNGRNVLDGSFGSAQFQVGANVGQTISLNLSTGVRTSDIGSVASFDSDAGGLLNEFTFGAVSVTDDVLNGDTFALNIGGISVDVTFSSGADATTALTGPQATTDIAAAIESARSDLESAGFVFTDGSGGTLASTTAIDGSNLATTAIARGDGEAFVITQSANIADAGGDVEFASIAGLTAGNVDAFEVEIAAGTLSIQVGSNADNAVEVAADTYSAQGLVDAINTALAGNGSATLNNDGTLTINAADSITIEATGNAANIFTDATEGVSGNISNIDVNTVDNANEAILRIDSALTAVSDLRSTFGSIQNRFESTIENLTTTNENLQASRSRILDADFAAETANLTRVQILQQAGISVLSQANVQPQNVLALLQ